MKNNSEISGGNMKTKHPGAYILAALFVVAFFAGCSTTTTTPAPAAQDWRFHDIVDVAFVQQYAKVPMAGDVMIIDARPKRAKYDKGHIPMAVSIPDSQFDKMTDQLPADKDALLIYYCGGPKCKLSHKSAAKAEALGYQNVKVFEAGFPGWMAVEGNYAAVSDTWMKQQIDAGADMIVVDSRPKRTKYDKGHIPTAISVPDSQFEKLSEQLPRRQKQVAGVLLRRLQVQAEPQVSRKSHRDGLYQRQGFCRRLSGLENGCRYGHGRESSSKTDQGRGGRRQHRHRRL
jgi:rhodanese-related sulfurtransferase